MSTKYKCTPTIFPKSIGKYNMTGKFTEHPLLFFGREDVNVYQEKAGGTHKEFAKRLYESTEYIMTHRKYYLPPVTYEEFGASWNEKYGNNLPVLSMSYILKPQNKDLLGYIILYMDRMVAYRSWYVIGLETDEVPVAHSLMGFATAFDMIYNELDNNRRDRYIKKLQNVSKLMYDMSLKRWWGQSFIQNHVATNVVAMFSSSLVLKMHIPEASKWLQHSLIILDRNMYLLSGISDGSLSEGVTYGSYTSRYVYHSSESGFFPDFYISLFCRILSD